LFHPISNSLLVSNYSFGAKDHWSFELNQHFSALLVWCQRRWTRNHVLPAISQKLDNLAATWTRKVCCLFGKTWKTRHTTKWALKFYNFIPKLTFLLLNLVKKNCWCLFRYLRLSWHFWLLTMLKPETGS